MSARARKHRLSAQDGVFAALFLCAVVLSCWKCRYGLGGNDEIFYLTIPHRLAMGDVFFRHEWNASQLSGFLLLPFVSIYRAVTGSMEGIVLAARYHYVLVHGIVAVFIYHRLKKFGPAAVPAALVFFLFTPYGIMAMSYNTMGLDLVVLTGVLMATSDLSRRRGPAAAGLAFAGAVLCCPFLLAVYLVFALFTGISCAYKRSPRSRYEIKDDGLFSLPIFLRFTAGAAALAAMFLVFVLSRGGFRDLTTDLAHILSEPDHPSYDLRQLLMGYCRTLAFGYSHHRRAMLLHAVMVLVMLLDKKRRDHRLAYLLVSAGAALAGYLTMAPDVVDKYYNAIMFPLVYPGFTSWCLCDKKPPRLFPCLFVLGGLYSAAIFSGSNNGFYVISLAFSVSNIASILFMGQLLREIWHDGAGTARKKALLRAGCVLAAAALVPFGALLLKTKVLSCFFESGTPFTLVHQVRGGPAKGICTDEEKQTAYDALHQDMMYYAEKEPGNILMACQNIVCYLDADMPYGTYSAWLSGSFGFRMDSLAEYYRLSPEKRPKYIYIPKSTNWEISNLAENAKTWGYSIRENDFSYKLERVSAP